MGTEKLWEEVNTIVPVCTLIHKIIQKSQRGHALTGQILSRVHELSCNSIWRRKFAIRLWLLCATIDRKTLKKISSQSVLRLWLEERSYYVTYQLQLWSSFTEMTKCLSSFKDMRRLLEYSCLLMQSSIQWYTISGVLNFVYFIRNSRDLGNPARRTFPNLFTHPGICVGRPESNQLKLKLLNKYCIPHDML